jgi:hypothetical protein
MFRRNPALTAARSLAAAFLLGLLSLCLAASPAAAQLAVPVGRPKSCPVESYFIAFAPFHDGDLKKAERAFRDAGRGGIRSTEGVWIDSICYHTMIGESRYQMGDLPGALDQYTMALRVFLSHRDWMLRVDFPPSLGPAQNLNTNITWGRSGRTSTIGHFQDRFPSLQGRLDNDEVIRRGGVVAAPQYYPVHVAEIVRCTSLALSRRRQIMGPACEHDALTTELVTALSRRPGPPNHWSQCWIELQLGLAYASANKISQAGSELTKSLLAGGQYDHPLTCVGLLELGRLAFEQGKYDAATTFFHESTISAAYFERYDVMEEAFRLGAQAHLVSGQPGAYAPLVPAAAAARKYRLLQASILASLADCLCTAGDLKGATGALNQARAAMNRREMALGAVGARVNYQQARVSLQSGDAKPGTTALNAALAWQKVASPRLFQIGFADQLYGQGKVTERVADQLYAEVLREPNRSDWIVDPLDTLAVQLTTPLRPLEHWFDLALSRKEVDKAIQIADRIRRHRFYATQPLGGRLLALRWVLEAPPETLTPDALLQRQDLLAKYPKYAELSRRAGELKTELTRLPLVPEGEEARKQTALLGDLARVSIQQETFIQLMALERLPSEFVFPPLRETKDIQAALPEGTLVLVYLATSRNLHGFAIGREQYAHFPVAAPARLKTEVGDVLRLWGHNDRTQPVAVEDLQGDAWREPAAKLLAALTNNTRADSWEQFREVIIVPDGPLWYLPFEALPVERPDGPSSLLAQVPVRYAPTFSLIVPDDRGNRPLGRTAVVAGKLLARDDDAFAQQAVEAVALALPGSALLPANLPAASGTFAAALDRLVVMANHDDSDKLPYAWSPLVLDAGKPGSSLAEWTGLPWGGAEQIVLPGFHTPAEYALKRGGTGDEVFFTVCGLMASGSRTILLSRWRVGGQSTVDLVREFVQELPHEPASAAWRRSVQLFSGNVLDPAREGRLKASAAASGVSAEHPFFWSGYMLVDTGVQPPRDAPAVVDAPAAPAAIPAPPAAAPIPAEAAPAEAAPADTAPAVEP